MVERSGNFINKKIAAIVLATTMVGSVGCAEARTAETSNNIPTSVEDTVGTSETTKLVTPEITVTPTPVETTAAPVETDVNVELAAAPEIAGLNKEIQDGKVVYKAVEGNEYGIEAGEFAGEYNPEISVEGSKVGGVALEPKVVTKILNDELAKIPEGENKMKVVIPLDITEVTKEDNFDIHTGYDQAYSDFFGRDITQIIATFNNPLTFINSCIKDNQLNTVDQIMQPPSIDLENGKTVSFKKEETQGFVPFESFIKVGENNKSEVGIGDIYYLFNEDKTEADIEIKNFDESKKYKIGEKTNIHVNSSMIIYYDWYNAKAITVDDLLKTDEGAVIFTYPQEATEAGN